MTRRNLLERELTRVLPILRDRYRAEKVIVFGSFASRRRLRRGSDIDLLIVKPTRQRLRKRLVEVANLLEDHGRVDALVYTPAEVRRLLALKPSFLKDEVFKKGRVLYSRT